MPSGRSGAHTSISAEISARLPSGPGNDVFFMVRDPDGNLAEISAEIEVCAPERPEGIWPHEQRTLNLWGMALMRT